MTTYSHLNGLTHGEARVYTAIRRQGSVGASMGFLVDILGKSPDTIRQHILRINEALSGGESIWSIADRYHVVGAEEVIRAASIEDKFYQPLWA